jgi:glyoxylase-like metal-dependent hydrolase (beta-lactamase superfamily II)/ferredoxin
MAQATLRRVENVPGPWFVDRSCIDCGTCMWMAPHAFREANGQSAVHLQPVHDDPAAAAALVACPTASIGGPPGAPQLGVAQFPRPIAPGVWHCGYHDAASFGAASYLVKTEAGNVLVDAPRFAAPLVKAMEQFGGVQHIVFTHRDDVGAHDKWAKHFGAARHIHEGDAVIPAEHELMGSEGSVAGLQWTHVPGHTKGSTVFRHHDVIFTGDHLAGRADGLTAFRGACWYDWDQQIQSMARMKDWDIAHVLPGHGDPWHGRPGDFQRAMAQLLDWMRRVA